VAAGMAPLSLGLRHGRLDPAAGGADRDGRASSRPTAGLALRAGGVRVEPRPDRPLRPLGAGRGAAGAGDLGHDPLDSTSVRPAGAESHDAAGAGRGGAAAGSPEGVLRRGAWIPR
jgi:hypothetical protein